MRDPAVQLRDYAASVDASAPSFDPAEIRARAASTIADVGVPAPVAPRRSGRLRVAAAALVVLMFGAAVLVARRAGDESTVAVTPAPTQAQGWTDLPGFEHTPDVGELRSFERSQAFWTGNEVLFVGALRRQTDRAAVLGRIPALDPESGAWRLVDPPPFDFLDQQYVAVWTDSELVVLGAALDADGWGTRAAAFDPSSGWRSLVNPPPEFKDVDDLGGVVWTGEEIVVSTSTGGVLAYQPSGSGAWRQVIEYDGVPYEQRRSVVWDGTRLLFFGGTADDVTVVGGAPVFVVDGSGTTAASGAGTLHIPVDEVSPRGAVGIAPGWAPARPVWTGTRVGFLQQVPETDSTSDPAFAVRDIWWATRDGGLQRDTVGFGAASPDPAIVWSGDEIALFGGRGPDPDRAVRFGVVKDVASGDERPIADLPGGSIPITDGLLAGDRLIGWGANPGEGHRPSLRVVSIPVDEVFGGDDGVAELPPGSSVGSAPGTTVQDPGQPTVTVPTVADPYVEVDGDPTALPVEHPVAVRGSIGQPPRLAASTSVQVTVELCHFGMVETDTTCDTSSTVSVWSDLAGVFSATLAPDPSFLSRCRTAGSESMCSARARWVSGDSGEQSVSTPPLQFAFP